MTNYDKYPTAEERAKGFETFCAEHICENCPLNEIKPDCGDSRGQFAWLDIEAEDDEEDNEKILPCPFCGGVCITSNAVCGMWRVYCERNLSCCYSSGSYVEESSAIAAHNRIARAVMKDK